MSLLALMLEDIPIMVVSKLISDRALLWWEDTAGRHGNDRHGNGEPWLLALSPTQEERMLAL